LSLLSPQPGGASLARGYRNLTEREIRSRLDGETLSEIERVTAKAELLRRGAGDDAPDTAFVSGFQPTSAMDIGAVESESEPPADEAAPAAPPASSRRLWPVLAVLALGIAGGLAWAVHANAIHL
jgi:anti-sigma factor RsiW